MDTDVAVFLFVVALRLFVPLGILRFPLPFVIAALVIDAADQTIFQQYTDLNLDAYQSYDKALDIYYLTIAFLSTKRNWRHLPAFQVAMFLWYYRLFGTTMFELTQWRPLLLIFPNTFEYFFIAIEAVRTSWDPARMSRRNVYLTAAAIWIFIKLPQEYWIHIAKLDTTDLLKEDVFGVATDSSWGTALTNRPVVTAVIAIVLVAIGVAVRMIVHRLPARDHATTFDADQVSPVPHEPRVLPNIFNLHLAEKVVLLSLIAIILGSALPGSTASTLQVIVATALVVVLNATASHFLRKRGISADALAIEFAGMCALNGAIAWFLLAIAPSSMETNTGGTIFVLGIISLVITLYDRYSDRSVDQWIDYAGSTPAATS